MTDIEVNEHATASTLEVTITHNLRELAEVMVLLNQKLIALDWDRLGPDPASYQGRAKTDVMLFQRMRTQGAAVIAAYKGATTRRSDRLVGYVEPGAEFRLDVNGLLCLPLSRAKVVDASISFLGQLVPRQCTIQQCGVRAKGRLAALVLGHVLPRSVWTLHHLDVEWLVTNYLIANGLCANVWSGGRSFENVDHAGVSASGRPVLAQTTVSEGLVGTKAAKLLELAGEDRDLMVFGPATARGQCPPAIRFVSIEDVFAALDATPGGQWLIDRMLQRATEEAHV